MSSELGRLEARLLARLSRSDRVVLALVFALGVATMIIGRRAAGTLRPASAVELSKAIDDLDAPTRLPNTQLSDFAGTAKPLLERIEMPYGVVSFYAHWCGPCQKELPALARDLEGRATILAVISKDEDLEHTKRQLANLDLAEVRAVVDETGELYREARVTTLPTTFLVNRLGVVRLRSKGFSHVDLWRMKELLDRDRRER